MLRLCCPSLSAITHHSRAVRCARTRLLALCRQHTSTDTSKNNHGVLRSHQQALHTVRLRANYRGAADMAVSGNVLPLLAPQSFAQGTLVRNIPSQRHADFLEKVGL